MARSPTAGGEQRDARDLETGGCEIRRGEIGRGAPDASRWSAEAARSARLAGMSVMAKEAAATGQLAVSEEECRDVVWSMTDGVLWHRLVVERGWTSDQFAAWLGQIWVHMLVQPRRRQVKKR